MFAIIAGSAIVRLFFLHPTFSDENLHFNIAKNISNGLMPYKDFFFAHPPLQVYFLAFLFKIFGPSFLLAKLPTLAASSLSALMVYLILKELYDERSGFVASTIFLMTPPFLSFSLIGYGVWETMLLVLISVYSILKNKLPAASLAFVFAVFIRYLTVVYLPFLLVLIYFRKQRLPRFLIPFFLLMFAAILLSVSIFGTDYFNQTVSYHLVSKISGQTAEPAQYWGMGFFLIFLALISAHVSYMERDKILFLFSLILLIADTAILLSLKLFFYHYFLVSLPFCIMAVGRSLTVSKDLIIRASLLFIIFLSVVSNPQTIDFYLNASNAEKFHHIAEFVKNGTSAADKIFGEPTAINFVSFIAGREISGNYLDSYLQHLTFEGVEKVVENLEKYKPTIFIEMELEGKPYYLGNSHFRDFVSDNYGLEKSFEGVPSYFLYELRIR